MTYANAAAGEYTYQPAVFNYSTALITPTLLATGALRLQMSARDGGGGIVGGAAAADDENPACNQGLTCAKGGAVQVETRD
jgi:hypothetical protein